MKKTWQRKSSHKFTNNMQINWIKIIMILFSQILFSLSLLLLISFYINFALHFLSLPPLLSSPFPTSPFSPLSPSNNFFFLSLIPCLPFCFILFQRRTNVFPFEFFFGFAGPFGFACFKVSNNEFTLVLILVAKYDLAALI